MISKQELAKFIDTGIEQAICGAIMLDPTQALKVGPTLSAKDFSDSDLGDMFEFLCDFVESGGNSTEFQVVRAELIKRKLWQRIGERNGIAEMIAQCGSAASAVDYADTIRFLSGRRKLMIAAHDIYLKAQEMSLSLEELIGYGQAQLGYVAVSGVSSVNNISQCLNNSLAKKKISSESKQSQAISTGLLSLDRLTGGVHMRNMTVIACRPSVGKTSLGTQIGLDAALMGKRVLFVSIEMPEDDIADRIFSYNSGIENRLVRGGVLEQDQIDNLQRIANEYDGVEFMLWHPGKAVTVSEIKAKARVISKSVGLDMLIVDYLQEIKAGYRAERHEQLESITKELKMLTLEIGCASIILAQLNRGAEDGDPKLSDLKGSGAIEESGDSVWLVDRKRGMSEAKIIVAKSRGGDVGVVPLEFHAITTRFQDVV